MCVHHGEPLIPIPGANVFLTDSDLTTPVLDDGSQLVTCRKLTHHEEIVLFWKGLRILQILGL